MVIVSDLFRSFEKLTQDSSYVADPSDKFTVELFRLLRSLPHRQALNLKRAVEAHLRNRFVVFSLKISEKAISPVAAKLLNTLRQDRFQSMIASTPPQHFSIDLPGLDAIHLRHLPAVSNMYRESTIWVYDVFFGISLLSNILDTYSKLDSRMLNPLTTCSEMLDVADLQQCLCSFRNSLLGLEARRLDLLITDFRRVSVDVPIGDDSDLEGFIPCIKYLLYQLARVLCGVFESPKTSNACGEILSTLMLALKEALKLPYLPVFDNLDTSQGGSSEVTFVKNSGFRNIWGARKYLYCSIDLNICLICESSLSLSSSSSQAAAVDKACRSDICQFCQCRHAVMWCDVKESLSVSADRHQLVVRLLEESVTLLGKSRRALSSNNMLYLLHVQQGILFDGARRVLSAIASIERLMTAWPTFCRWPAILAVILQDKPALMSDIISLEKSDGATNSGTTFKQQSLCLMKAKDKLDGEAMTTLKRWVKVAKSELAYLQVLQKGQT